MGRPPNVSTACHVTRLCRCRAWNRWYYRKLYPQLGALARMRSFPAGDNKSKIDANKNNLSVASWCASVLCHVGQPSNLSIATTTTCAHPTLFRFQITCQKNNSKRGEFSVRALFWTTSKRVDHFNVLTSHFLEFRMPWTEPSQL